MQVISRPAALLACVSLMNTLAFCGVTTLYGRISAYHRRLRCVLPHGCAVSFHPLALLDKRLTFGEDPSKALLLLYKCTSDCL